MTTYPWIADGINPGVSECVGKLTINNINMHRRAWNVLSVYPLVQTTPELIGENVRVNGVVGRRMYPLEPDQTDAIVEITVSGLYDENDNRTDLHRFTQQRHNYRYLKDNVLGPKDGVTAAWYATIEWEDGTVEEAYVQVLDISVNMNDEDFATGTMTVRIGASDWTEVTS